MSYNQVLAERMRAHLKTRKGIIDKGMFGGIGFLVNGNMACGVNKQDLIVRLNDSDFQIAIQKPHVRVFDLGGRPMKAWILISPEGCVGKKVLLRWLDKGIAQASSLPPK